MPVSLNVLVNAICDNLAGLLVDELLRALNRNTCRANQVNNQYVGVHLLLQRPNDILIVHKDRSAVRRVERDDFFLLVTLRRNQRAKGGAGS